MCSGLIQLVVGRVSVSEPCLSVELLPYPLREENGVVPDKRELLPNAGEPVLLL